MRVVDRCIGMACSVGVVRGLRARIFTQLLLMILPPSLFARR